MEEERRNRKAFQAKVKDFSEDIIVSVGMTTTHSIPLPSYQHSAVFHKLLGRRYYQPAPGCSSVPNYDDAYIYKRAGCTPLPFPTDPNYQTLYDADRVNRDKAFNDFKHTTFDGTEK